MEADPGWGFSWKSMPLVFAPQAMRRAGRSGRDPLLDLRFVFLTFVAAIFSIGVVAFFLGNMSGRPDRTGLSVAIVVAVGCTSLLAQRVVPRPLDCTSLESLASSYRTRFFLRIAISDAAALVAFCVDIALGPWWVYFVGAGFALIGFSQLAPTAGHLTLDQDSLSLKGCTLSLVDALRMQPASQL
jgi:hypothetical protein